jgi:hypothetical protein
LLAQAEAQGAGEVSDLSIVREFLEEDDGREFVMVNLVWVPDTMVTHPDTGAQVPAREMMQAYSKSLHAAADQTRRPSGAGGRGKSAATSIPGWWAPIPAGALSASCATARAATCSRWCSTPPSRPHINTSCWVSPRPFPSRPSPSYAPMSVRASGYPPKAWRHAL